MLEPMNRITLNVILQTIFGADGPELEELRALIPPYMKLGQLMAFVPAPPSWAGRLGPWGRLDKLREAFDRTVFTLIAAAEADPGLSRAGGRLGLSGAQRARRRSRDSRQDLCDELLTLLCAGHETTASALAWTFERLRRHPDVLAELAREVDEGGSEFRRATILKSLRVAHRHRCGRPPGQGAERRPRRLADSAGSHGAREDRRSARESGRLSSPRTVRSGSLPRHQGGGTDLARVRWRSTAMHRRRFRHR